MKTDALLIWANDNIRTKSVIVSLLSVILAYTPAGMALKFKELSDDQLAGMRGKYVAPSSGRVQYFGLTMNTSWKTPDFSHQVESKVFVDVSKNQPKVFVSKAGSLGKKVENSSSTSKSSSVFESVNGSVQSIQVAGSDNKVANQVSLSLAGKTEITSNYASAVPVTRVEILGLPAGLVSSVEETFQSDKGVTTTFNQNGSLGYTLASGNNVITQQIKGGITKQLLQAVVLQGNAHNVVNTIKLDASFIRNDSLGGSRIRALRGLYGLN